MTTKELALKYGKNEKDSGNPAVQVAILTEKIKGLTPHFNKHIHDYNSLRGMRKVIGQRRRLLKYINEKNPAMYAKLVEDLGIRKVTF